MREPERKKPEEKPKRVQVPSPSGEHVVTQLGVSNRDQGIPRGRTDSEHITFCLHNVLSSSCLPTFCPIYVVPGSRLLYLPARDSVGLHVSDLPPQQFLRECQFHSRGLDSDGGLADSGLVFPPVRLVTSRTARASRSDSE